MQTQAFKKMGKGGLGRKSYYGPLQRQLEDVPLIRLDMHGGQSHHSNVMNVLKKREEALSPFVIEVGGHRVHITPLDNSLLVPKKYLRLSPEDRPKRGSHHIIQIYSSKSLKKYRVDLLMEDHSLYYVAFRRHLVDLDAADVANGFKRGPGQWFAFSNELDNLPDFINATPIDMNSGYSGAISPGGSFKEMEKMLEQVATFEDNPIVTAEFKRANHNLMVLLAEVRRSRAMKREMDGRMIKWSVPEPLSDFLDKIMHMWGSMSGEAMSMRNKGTLSLGDALNEAYSIYPLSFRVLSDLIGLNGELLIVKHRRKDITLTEKELMKDAEFASFWKNVPNPFFSPI